MGRNEAQQVRCRAHLHSSVHHSFLSPQKKIRRKRKALTTSGRRSEGSIAGRRSQRRRGDSGSTNHQGNKTGGGGAEMGSPLGGWPSYNPHNFSQLVPADPSAQPSVGQHFPSLAISSLIYSN